MIDFEQVWLPQIISYARLISTGQLEDEWLGRSELTTSISDPDELHEQVFDDLDAAGIWASAGQADAMPASALSAIDAFLTALSGIEGNDPAIVVGSNTWAAVRVAADEVLANVA